MKKILYLFAIIVLTFTACQKDDDITSIPSSGPVSGLKNGTFEVNGSKVEPNQIAFSGGKIEARTSGTTNLKDIIIEIGNNFETKTYPLSKNAITSTTLRIEYQTGTSTLPIYWHSKSGNIAITDNLTSITADFKDITFEQANDPNRTVRISGYLSANI